MAQEATDTAPGSVQTDGPRAAGAPGATGSFRGARAARSFPWAIAPSATAADVAVARKRWYAGATFGLLWQSLLVIALWTDGRPLVDHVLGSVTLLIVYAAYLAAPELMWRRGLRSRVGVVTAFAVVSGLTLLSIGPIAVWSWLLVASLTGFIALRMWVAVLGIAVIVGAQLAVSAVVGWDAATDSGVLFAPLVTVSVGLSMVFFGRQRDAEDRLDVATDELTRLAVVEERARFSRDLHDVLGHSLTVVTMNSELAARLVDIDPERAKAEIADIERLSREALHGLRQAVGGYREADLEAELVAACAAFQAAGIEASVPGSGAAAARDVRSLFAWVLREGVTNVLRHAAATSARVTISRTALTVEDDGTGVSSDADPGVGPGAAAVGLGVGPGAAAVGLGAGAVGLGGNGLRGLRERAEASGAVIVTGTSELGGFLLRVERGRR